MIDFVFIYLLTTGLKFLLRPFYVIPLLGCIYSFFIYEGEANSWYMLTFFIVLGLLIGFIEKLINRWRVPFLEEHLTVTYRSFPREASNKDTGLYLITYIPGFFLLFTLLVISIRFSGLVEVNSLLFSMIFSLFSVYLYSMGKRVSIPSWSPNGSRPISEKKFDIHRAAEAGDMNKLKEIIAQGVDLDRKTNKKMAALHLAIEAEKLESVKLLVEGGANVELIGGDFRAKTPTMMAAKTGNLEIVKYLLSKGANINARGNDGNNVLYVSYKNAEMFDFLLSKGADIKNTDNAGEALLTIIMTRIPRSGDEARYFMELVKKILANGISPDGVPGEKSFPLLAAVSFKNYEAVKFLLLKGASANRNDLYGRTPLLVAINEGQIKLVNLMLKGGADIQFKGRANHTQKTKMTAIKCANWYLGQQTEDSDKKRYQAIVDTLVDIKNTKYA